MYFLKNSFYLDRLVLVLIGVCFWDLWESISSRYVASNVFEQNWKVTFCSFWTSMEFVTREFSKDELMVFEKYVFLVNIFGCRCDRFEKIKKFEFMYMVYLLPCRFRTTFSNVSIKADDEE